METTTAVVEAVQEMTELSVFADLVTGITGFLSLMTIVLGAVGLGLFRYLWLKGNVSHAQGRLKSMDAYIMREELIEKEKLPATYGKQTLFSRLFSKKS